MWAPEDRRPEESSLLRCKKVEEKTGFNTSVGLVVNFLWNYHLEGPVNCSKNYMTKPSSEADGGEDGHLRWAHVRRKCCSRKGWQTERRVSSSDHRLVTVTSFLCTAQPLGPSMEMEISVGFRMDFKVPTTSITITDYERQDEGREWRGWTSCVVMENILCNWSKVASEDPGHFWWLEM